MVWVVAQNLSAAFFQLVQWSAGGPAGNPGSTSLADIPGNICSSFGTEPGSIRRRTLVLAVVCVAGARAGHVSDDVKLRAGTHLS